MTRKILGVIALGICAGCDEETDPSSRSGILSIP
jgi:hypothetical protein